MSSNRKAALAAGIMLILADVAGVASQGVLGSLLDGTGFAANVAASTNRVALAAFLVATMGLACGGVGFALYPLLRPINSALAVSVAGMRLAEAVIFLMCGTVLASIATLSQDALAAGTIDSAAMNEAAGTLKAMYGIGGAFAALPFGIAAFLYYAAFWQTRMVPRWLSGWGLAAIVLYVLASSYALLTVTDVNGYSLWLMPFAVQELVFAIWLVGKGVTMASEPGRSTLEPAAVAA